MPVIRFHLDSTLSPAEVIGVLTDFTPARAEAWPTIDAEHFEVHGIGSNWADITEGTASAWEHAHYEWDAEAGRVDITTLDSKVFGPGGGWSFTVVPTDSGSRVDVELTRHPASVKGKLLASLLPLVAPNSLRKAFSGPLHATA
ncbi:hypothetical protein [Agromyces seonyuensis]|uniref:SRPBCC family protein n=1 Tax=Agromyces seonyuensis TaxID=2662446 RepID=A0A6I4NTS5_9MICO|nr:hypothetical protein [Agromyces seonyuensis]MWB97846.1 hypothetical protein [Agromyces seonyuensis]